MKRSAGKGDSSDSALQEKSWKSIWAINCPNKMKIILWRMAHDCLATGIQLQKRNIPTNDHCVFCGLDEILAFSVHCKSLEDTSDYHGGHVLAYLGSTE
jgi:hypothetical protein